MNEACSLPSWAPEGLKAIYLDRIERMKNRNPLWGPDESLEREIEFLGRLLKVNDENMATTWKEIFEQDRKSGSQYGSSPYLEQQLFYEMHYVLLESLRPLETKEKKAERYDEMAVIARSLASLIKGSHVDWQTYYYFPPEVLARFIEKAILESSEKLFHSGGIRLRSKWKENPESLLKLFERVFPSRSPSVSWVLENLAEKAEQVAADANSDETLLGYPGADGARRTIVIRGLAQIFYSRFGKPLYRIIASFATAILNDEVNEDMVGNALRGWDPPIRS